MRTALKGDFGRPLKGVFLNFRPIHIVQSNILFVAGKLIVVNPHSFMPDTGFLTALHGTADTDFVAGKGTVFDFRIPNTPGSIPKSHQIIEFQAIAVLSGAITNVSKLTL